MLLLRLEATGAAPAGTVRGRVLKLAAVLDQSDDTEIAEGETSKLLGYRNTYRAINKASPPPVRNPTDDQLSEFAFRVKTLNKAPFADFAVFVPFGKRSARAHKFCSWQLVGGGAYVTKEIPGPDFFVWSACFRVLWVALMMIGGGSSAALEAYLLRI